MEIFLPHLLPSLSTIWLLFGIICLWKLFWSATSPSDKDVDKESPKQPMVSQEQIESARQALVGKSKPFISPKNLESPAASPLKQTSENQPALALQNAQATEERTSKTTLPSPLEVEDEMVEGEMQIDYTMDEPDEESILREELQIADEALPEVSPTAILSRDLARITHWYKEDDEPSEEDRQFVHTSLEALRGTMLMEQLKENMLKQEHDHRQLLAAIRKAEEEAMEEDDTASDSAIPTERQEASGEAEHPLSYYL